MADKYNNVFLLKISVVFGKIILIPMMLVNVYTGFILVSVPFRMSISLIYFISKKFFTINASLYLTMVSVLIILSYIQNYLMDTITKLFDIMELETLFLWDFATNIYKLFPFRKVAYIFSIIIVFIGNLVTLNNSDVIF